MSYLALAGRTAALVVVLLIGRILGAMVAGLGGSGSADPGGAAAAESGALLLMLLGVCALEVLAWIYPIRRARWTGWRLTAVVFVVTFGVMSFQSQIEALFFDVLSARMTLRVLLMGLVTSALFAPMAVVLLGRWRIAGAHEPHVALPALQPRDWVRKLGAAALLYVVLYVTFGHFIAWQSADVRAFYGGAENGGGLETFGLFAVPLLGPWQALRGLIWVGLALPVLRMMGTDWRRSGFAIGVLFAVVMNAQLLLPNPYMPAAVRLVHLVETASSNLLLGLAIGWLFAGRRPDDGS